MEQFMIGSAALVLAGSFLLIFGLIINPAVINWYISIVPYPDLIEQASIGMKAAGMAFGASFGVFALVLGSGWLLISTVFYVIERLLGGFK